MSANHRYIGHFYTKYKASLIAQSVKNPPAVQTWVRSWVGKIPWRRKWQSTPVLLPGRSHGQRNLEGYSPQGHTQELATTEQLTMTKPPPPY